LLCTIERLNRMWVLTVKALSPDTLRQVFLQRARGPVLACWVPPVMEFRTHKTQKTARIEVGVTAIALFTFSYCFCVYWPK
jgi:hypothetical protein